MNILLGPPGTGKTETCLKTVEYFLSLGVPPERIGYFAFTRRANIEAKERAMGRFKLASNDLPYFKTLHSLAFGRIGISHNQLMTEQDYTEIARWLSVDPFVIKSTDRTRLGYGDPFLELINMSRVTGIPLRDIYNNSPVRYSLDWANLEYVQRGIEKYKMSTRKYDYTDLLESFVRSDMAPKLEVLIIDEAQDLSALQWRMVEALARRAENVFIAGDDDQAIYRWAGADVTQFIHKEGAVHVLNQSYRIPRSHHAISQRLIRKVIDRRAKEFMPREEQGMVQWHRHSEEVDLGNGDWLLLSRTRAGADQLENEVRQRGLMYNYDDSSRDGKSFEAVRLWEHLRAGERLNVDDIRKVYAKMVAGVSVAHKHRLLANIDSENWFNISDLVHHHGLLTTAPWRHALGRINEQEKQYIAACLRAGDALTEKPRITISTIHKAKGTQATNVLMTTDIPKQRTLLWRQEDYDDEARVFYVGLTRAKKELHLIHPMHSSGFAIPHGEACSRAA
jgi:superfamily I DNA/RNA helicase